MSQSNLKQEDNINTMSLHRRRLSLFQKNHHEHLTKQRQQIRNRYYKYIQNKKIKNLQQIPHSPQTTTDDKLGEQTNRSMPSIRFVREESQLIGQTLRQTINRYNFMNHQKEKKLQTLNRKKIKFQKILKLRQQHSVQKKRLNQSLTSLHKQISMEKYKLKHSVDVTKQHAYESRIKVVNFKRQMGKQRREQIQKNKFQIEMNKSMEFQTCKKLHQSVFVGQKQLKVRLKTIRQQKKKIGADQYCTKLKKQVKQFAEIDQRQIKTKFKLQNKIDQLEKSKRVIDQRLKNYQQILKDGSTLKKNKVHLKFKRLDDRQKSKLTSVYTQSQQESFY